MLFFARINLTTPLRQGETHLVCLSCSAESASKAFSLALHSVPRVFHVALSSILNTILISILSPILSSILWLLIQLLIN